MGKANYSDIILEDVNSKLDLILETLMPLTVLPAEMREVREELEDINNKFDVSTVVIKDHSHQLSSHETRIAKLESA